MPLSDHTKIMLGWVGVWISGGGTFFLLQKHIEYSRKERMKERRIKRRERERKRREKEETDTAAAGQQQLPQSV